MMKQLQDILGEHFVQALAEIMGTSGALLVVLAVISLAVMAAFLPIFVFRIMRDVNAIKKNTDEMVYQLRDRF